MPHPGNTPRPALICLAGFMGCGKTTVGRMLARQLAWRFVDLDTRIEEHTGLAISEMFDRMGEPEFRQIERERLLHALGQAAELGQATVLALGGGTFAQPENVELLRAFKAADAPTGAAGSVVIWLDCPVDVLLQRCATMKNRPLFKDEHSFRDLYDQRQPFYQQADYRVESDADPGLIVERIVALGILEPRSGLPGKSTGKVNA